MWTRYEGNTIVPDSPLTLRLSHPAAYLVFPTFDLFDVIQPLGATSTTPLYTDAAWNQVWLDTVSVATTARVPYTYTAPRVGGGTLLGTSNQAGSYYIKRRQPLQSRLYGVRYRGRELWILARTARPAVVSLLAEQTRP
jgi:hypothetical protein